MLCKVEGLDLALANAVLGTGGEHQQQQLCLGVPFQSGGCLRLSGQGCVTRRVDLGSPPHQLQGSVVLELELADGGGRADGVLVWVEWDGWEGGGGPVAYSPPSTLVLLPPGGGTAMKRVRVSVSDGDVMAAWEE